MADSVHRVPAGCSPPPAWGHHLARVYSLQTRPHGQPATPAQPGPDLPRQAGAAMAEVKISIDDPRANDVRTLVECHLDFAKSHKPPGDMHALDIAGLLDSAVTMFSYRAGGELLAVGALRRLNGRHAELKSMHTAEAARGRGIGRAMVAHLIGVARVRGFRRVSLKTGSQPAFAPARSLYASAGFTMCGPFGHYQPSRDSTFMTLALDGPHLAA